MNFYRLYFSADGHIVHRHDFYADDDGIASKAAALVLDACSEACDELELWDGKRLIVKINMSRMESAILNSHETGKTSATARDVSARAEQVWAPVERVSAALAEMIEELALDIEQTISASDWRFRTSQRLQANIIEKSRDR